MRQLLIGLLSVLAAPVWAASLPEEVADAMSGAQVVLLGEVHDNPDHHTRQAEAVARLAPKAVVWEMLTAVQAARFDAKLMKDPDAMAEALDWAASGWPEFALYHP